MSKKEKILDNLEDGIGIGGLHYAKKRVLVKQPIEVIHKKRRFGYLYKKICNKLPKKTKDDVKKMIIISIYDNVECDYIVHNMAYNNYLSKANHVEMLLKSSSSVSKKNYYYDKEWLKELPVLDCVELTTSDGESTFYIELKYLPKNYVNDILYKDGYITEEIYDQITVSKNKDVRTVISKEAIEHLKNMSDITNDDILLKHFNDICGNKTKLTPSYDKDGLLCWYILSRQNPPKKTRPKHMYA